MIPIWLLIAHIFWYLIDSNAIIWSNKIVEFIFPPIILQQENDHHHHSIENIKINDSNINHTIIYE